MFKVTHISHNKLIVGVLLIVVGISLPNFLSVYSFGIINNLSSAILDKEKLDLFKAGISLVLLNSFRAYPHYIGTYYLSDAFTFTDDSWGNKYAKMLINFCVIPIVYQLIFLSSGIRYHLGIPALILILLISYLGKRGHKYVSEWKKIFLIMFSITSIQFLDIVPMLSFMPFGRGETSLEVKLISAFLNVQDELSIFALSLFLVFLVFSMLLYMLIRDENNLLEMNALRKENIILANETRLKNLENRSFQEVRHLVHDLKSPLTSAQALVSLVKQSCGTKGMVREDEYLGRVENSIDKISIMISEILSEKARFSITTNEVVDSLLSNISTTSYSSSVEVENNADGAYIFVNKVYFIRALVNIVENAHQALMGADGFIMMKVNRVTIAGNGFIQFEIMDNGKGIKSSELKNIWETGYSTKNSFGLGLGFVTKVIQQSEGEMYLESKENKGTTVTILLKEDEHGR